MPLYRSEFFFNKFIVISSNGFVLFVFALVPSSKRRLAYVRFFFHWETTFGIGHVFFNFLVPTNHMHKKV